MGDPCLSQMANREISYWKRHHSTSMWWPFGAKKASSPYPTDPGEAHYDLISAIWQLQHNLPSEFHFEHVKGHQDNGTSTAFLQLAWMNINMDTQAKSKLLSPGPTQQLQNIPFKGRTCAIEDWWKIKKPNTGLRQHLNGKIILNHWAMKECFSPQISKTSDWKSAAKAMNSLSLSHWQWVSKLAAKFLPDGKNMQQWGLQPQAKCPQCTRPVKDKEHIFKCPLESVRIQQWEKAIEELDLWLETAKIHLQLRKDIIEGLKQWHDQTPGCRPYTKGSSAGQLQDSIGWGWALKGCIAKRWQEEQEQYWKAFKSSKLSKR